MKIEHLAYLVKIAEYKSLNLAGEKLHITQQALSLAVKALEREFEAQLLVRTRQGVSLTENGEKVVAMATAVLAQIEAVRAAISAKKPADSPLQGQMVCLINQGLNYSYLPRVVSKFYSQYPKISLELAGLRTEAIIQRISQRQGDLGLINMLEIEGEKVGYTLPECLCWRPIHTFNMCALVNVKSPLAGYKTLSIKTLIRQPIAICPEYEPLEDYLLYKLLTYYGEPKIKMVHASVMCKQMVVDNQAVSVTMLEDTLFVAGMEQTKLIPIKNKIKMQVGYIYHRDLVLNDVQRAFLKVLQEIKV